MKKYLKDKRFWLLKYNVECAEGAPQEWYCLKSTIIKQHYRIANLKLAPLPILKPIMRFSKWSNALLIWFCRSQYLSLTKSLLLHYMLQGDQIKKYLKFESFSSKRQKLHKVVTQHMQIDPIDMTSRPAAQGPPCKTKGTNPNIYIQPSKTKG